MSWKWFKSSASEMQDVSAAAWSALGSVVLAGKNGTVWRMPSWNHFVQDHASGFRRVALSPDGTYLFGVGANGTVWYSTQPGIWVRLTATDQLHSPVEDAVVNYDNSLWITLKNGQMWSIRDGVHWEARTVLAPFTRLAVDPRNQWWGIDAEGNLLRRDGNQGDASYWIDTAGSGMEDVSVSPNGIVWLVGRNGTVWHTQNGQTFTQVQASGFHSVSAVGDELIYFVGSNGTLWSYQTVPETHPGGGSGGTGGGTGGGSPAQPQVHLRVEDQAADFSIVSVQWTIFRQGLGTVSFVTSVIQVSADLTLPVNGQYYVRADVTVFRPATGQNELAEFRGNGAFVNGLPVIQFVLGASDQTKQFRLIEENQNGYINPVVILVA